MYGCFSFSSLIFLFALCSVPFFVSVCRFHFSWCFFLSFPPLQFILFYLVLFCFGQFSPPLFSFSFALCRFVQFSLRSPYSSFCILAFVRFFRFCYSSVFIFVFSSFVYNMLSFVFFLASSHLVQCRFVERLSFISTSFCCSYFCLHLFLFRFRLFYSIYFCFIGPLLYLFYFMPLCFASFRFAVFVCLPFS